ncbi:MAG TPA: dipeptidase, partial [Thermomicrobiales bacterium]|nr:dipeptidase [Thermomicrobiales bacterium]
MSSSQFPAVFDGHNDTVLSLTRTGRSFFERSEQGHIDLPRAREGGLGGGFFAVYIADPLPPELEGKELTPRHVLDRYGDESRFPEPMDLDYAQNRALALLGTLLKLENESNGECKIVRTASELQQCLDEGVFAMLLHFEGAEPLDFDGDALEVFYATGLRSLGLTHSRRNRYATGVPFKFPSSPDTGSGLTDAGRELVRQCNRRKVMLDLSHITEQGFWDVAGITDAPLVATHSNYHALCESPRNLTVKQLAAIKESRGMVGLNFHVGFLREDGAFDSDTPLSVMADHLERLVEHASIDCVGLGTDYDGALMPDEL